MNLIARERNILKWFYVRDKSFKCIFEMIKMTFPKIIFNYDNKTSLYIINPIKHNDSQSHTLLFFIYYTCFIDDIISHA